MKNSELQEYLNKFNGEDEVLIEVEEGVIGEQAINAITVLPMSNALILLSRQS